MTVLTSDWQILTSTQGGEVVAMDDGDRIRVSFPEDVPEYELREILANQAITVGDNVVFEPGESTGETVAFFSKTS